MGVKAFLLRIFVFALLWSYFLYSSFFHHSAHLALLVFLSACAIGCYFFLPVVQHPLPLYIIVDLFILFSGWLQSDADQHAALLLILYLYTEAIFQLKKQLFRWFTVFHVVVSILIASFLPNAFEWLMAFAMFSFISVVLNEYIFERKEQRELYEQLLGEYRKLKRFSYQNERSARLEERTKIARDIHDSVGHKLTALLMQLEMLSIKERKKEYEELKALVRESLEETRHAVRALKMDESEGISSVLQLIRKLESESHIMVHFTTKQGVLSARLTNLQNIVLYRVIQEALTNAMRHAQSREVYIILGKNAIGDLEFSIKNRIFNAKPFQIGFGLTNMKERVEEAGGSLNVFQTNDEFVVHGTLPIKEYE